MNILRAVFLCVGLVCAAHAQFEGRIVWSMQAELTDPTISAQLGAAGARLQSPEVQSQLAEARRQLESPEMKAMLEQNPQMKAMLENQMAMLGGKSSGAGAAGAPLGGLFPTGLVLHLKGTDSLARTEGGMMPRDVLTLGAKREVYLLDPAAKTYAKLPAGSGSGSADVARYRVTKSTETRQILGYACTRYDVQGADFAGESLTFTVWVTPAVKGVDARQFRSMRLGGDTDAGFLASVDGVPLRIDMQHPQAKVAMEVTAITPEPQAASLFAIPAGYTATAAPGIR